MKTMMVRYKTTEEYADTNEARVHAVFNELRAKAPPGIRYATYRLTDRVTFIHVATMSSPEHQDSLSNLPAFQTFQQQLKQGLVEGPVFTELSPVDSYGVG